MSRIRFITSSDEHLADLPPGFRKDDYRSTVLKKLEWQGSLAKNCGANAILRGGDIFHVKAANKNTHALIQMMTSLFNTFECPTYALAGNHDMSNNEFDSVFRQQPLGVLFRTGVLSHLNDNVFLDGSLKVRVVGVDYTPDIDVDFIQEKVKKRDDDVYTVAVVHALASMAPSEKIQSFFNEKIFDYRDLVFPGCPDAYVFGHYHKDQGITDHLGVKFINLGSISRGALTFENLERKPKVSMLTFDSSGVSAEEVCIPCLDPSEVFDLDLKKKIDTERKDLNEFISKLRTDSSVSFSDKKHELDKFPDDLKKLALQILESAEFGSSDL